jgi:Fe-S-cluster containining protein
MGKINAQLKVLLDKAQVEQAETRVFFERVKKKKPRDLDSKIHDLHQKTFKKIDCLDCANCCSTTSPIFRDVDIKRLSKHLKMKESQFVSAYLKMDEESDYVLRQSPCAFLGNDNKCSVYEHRPLACREYPHTDRKNMIQILGITEKNTLICPAVSTIIEELKKAYL